MLNSLYVEAVRKKGSIKEIIPKLESNSSVSEKWNDLIINSSSDDFSIGAGDGSFNKKNFLTFTFYAIACESLIYDGKLKKFENSDIDTISHYNFTDDLLRNYMSIYEVKSALKSIKEYNVDYYLFDGSLLGDLIRHFPLGFILSKEKKEEIVKTTKDMFKEEIASFAVEISSTKILNRFYKPIHSEEFSYKMFLSSLEKLLALYELLKEKKKIIAISKTSTNNKIFKSNIPDIAIFDKYTQSEGKSNEYYLPISNEVKHVFPIENDFFKSLEFTVFYLRLDKGKNVLKVELPYKASSREIEDIIEKLKKYSTEGYPYLLKKAHNDVVISNKNIKELANIIKIREKSGREMLN